MMSERNCRSWSSVVLLAALAVAWAAPAFAQAGRISGRIRDSASGSPIKGATVVAENPNGMPNSFTSVSDEKGRFSMLGLRGGTWLLTVSAPGYLPIQGATRVGSFGSGPSMELTLTKAPEPVVSPLTHVDVKALQQELSAAESLMDAGQYDGAIEAYRTILTKVPVLTSVNLEVARAYRAKKDFASAAAACEKILEKDPANEAAQVMLGITHLEAGDLAAAERVLGAAAAQPGAGALAFNAMGALKRAQGSPEDAARWFEKTTNVEPTWAAPLLALGELAMDRGDTAAAATLFEKVIALDGDGPDGARAKELLKK